jgi:ribosomal protein S27AE
MLGRERSGYEGEMGDSIEYAEDVCPRCGHTANYFDRLSVQPNYVAERFLIPVHKCPSCKHLWALTPAAWLPVLRESGLLGK